MIKGKLVGLRAVERDDLMLMRDWRNNPDFRKNFREVRELNMEDQELWYNMNCVNNPNNFMFIIERLKDHKPVGAAGLLYINWIIRSADFSFYIGEDGAYIDDEEYAEDAANLLINYGFHSLNLHKIWMELYDSDIKKMNFFTTKFNFVTDGKLRDNYFENSTYGNSYIISLINNQ